MSLKYRVKEYCIMHTTFMTNCNIDLSINYRNVCLLISLELLDLKLDKCLTMGTSKCSAKFDIVWIRNAKDIAKYGHFGLVL